MSERDVAWVVYKPDRRGRLYLDDTGTGVRDLAEAKRFVTAEDARMGVRIAELAPTGGEEAEWRIAPVS
jgi:hypothetical protein